MPMKITTPALPHLLFEWEPAAGTVHAINPVTRENVLVADKVVVQDGARIAVHAFTAGYVARERDKIPIISVPKHHRMPADTGVYAAKT